MANKESSEAAKKIAKAEKEKTAKKPKKNKKNIHTFIHISPSGKQNFKNLWKFFSKCGRISIMTQ